MTSWEMLIWLNTHAEKNGYYPNFKPFKIGEGLKERPGHNSHYRFIWTKAWWVALFDNAYLPIAHKALDIALEEGPNEVVKYIYQSKVEYDQTKRGSDDPAYSGNDQN